MNNKKNLFIKGLFFGLILVVTILVFFKGKISFNEKNNYQIAFFNGNQKLENMPLKGNAENLVFDHAICDKEGVTVEWDKEKWAPLVKGLTVNKTKCTLYFVEEKIIDLDKDIPLADSGKDGLYAVEHNNLTELGSEWNKTEYRYAGANPDNYIEFNNEKWRIIGLVNVQTSTGVEQRLKIIRTDGIAGQKDFGKINWNYSGLYTANNNWIEATLKEMLNGIYYESSSGDFYYSTGNIDEEVLNNYNFTGNGNYPKGLKDVHNMIDSEVIWNLGGSDIVNNITTDMFYEKERGTSSGNNNEYPNVWTIENDATYHKGIGLIYPSDYGYATNGGTVGREECFDNIYTLSNENNYKTQCMENNWLINNQTYGNSDDLYTITPYVGNLWSNNITVILLPNIKDHVVGYGANMAAYVEPTLYLNKNVVIYDGDGTFNNPFKIKNE